MAKLDPEKQSAIWIIVLTLLIFCSMAIHGRVRFGSLPNALAYLEGDRILVDEQARDIGDMPAGNKPVVIHYSLTNLTGQPVTILASRASCSCTMVGGLPTVIPKSQARVVRIEVTPDPKSGLEYSGAVSLFTDSPVQREIPLIFTERIAQP